ncbi:hypothetical protein Nham_2986 [Nitrobacter hamburgensis X14]|uniref:Transmembrane protein n=1 Tax=Nitrobacter hamburgensis (strain DSM 10229 / NCIMB 13809 / X14) TaxID=323097 RepID=Q1QJ53_NITHX|nr:hypothetical protein Nham_2986 [Nitrobacter hamburgensis X14]
MDTGRVSIMQSKMILLRRLTDTSQSLRSVACATALILSALALGGSHAYAIPAIASAPHLHANQGDLIEKVVVVRRRGAVVGRRGGVAHRSRTVVRPGVGRRYVGPVRPVRPVGRWVRPARYWWPVGGAVAAGAAVGFVTAATASAWAGAPPAPGYCWYYTDSSRTKGFWDACPR